MIKKELAVSDTGFMFDPTNGNSYSMNGIASDIIAMLKDNKAEADIQAEILSKYDVDAGTFETDYADFIKVLSNFNLMR